MKPVSNKTLIPILLLALFPQFGLPDQPAALAEEPLEERAYVLAGYIPKFYEIPERGDPFDAAGWKQYKKEFKEYEESIVSILKECGMNPRKTKFIPEVNALILTDTRDNLERYEIAISNFMKPDMHLKGIRSAKKALNDDSMLIGDHLMRVGILDDTTFRAFHSEVRKLEETLKQLPADHKERIVVQGRLETAKKYRAEAINLCLESLDKQERLLMRWQSEQMKAEKGQGE